MVTTMVELLVALVCFALAGHILIQLVTGHRGSGSKRE